MPNDAPDPAPYRECFVAFLDVLGFKELIERSKSDPRLREAIRSLFHGWVRLDSGMKETIDGPCPMQARSFSDTVVVFTPTDSKYPGSSLAQLLFVVRYLHDRLLSLDGPSPLRVCFRGAVTIGEMYWPPAWNLPDKARRAPSPPLTFGPGLVAAHQLESNEAGVPRVLIGQELLARALKKRWKAYPYGARAKGIADYFRLDGDGKFHLDLLHQRVTRMADERLERTRGGFTIKWVSYDSRFEEVCRLTRALATEGLNRHAGNAVVRSKYAWLMDYVTVAEARAARERRR